jgi:hypothetical protein
MHYHFGWRRASALAKFLLGLAALALSGCMDLQTVVRVEADGSGTISDRIVMSNEIIEMMKGMAPEGQEVPLFNEEELQAAAYSYGEGVTFLSAEAIETGTGTGYVAYYAFEDINLIRVGQDPEDKMPGGGGMGASAEAGDEGSFTTFSMEPGYPASLTVHWPVDEGEPETMEETEAATMEESEAAQSPEQQEAAMEMMKTAFKDMRMALYIEIAGQVLETNATHLDGNRITLVDISFSEFLQNEEALKAMASDEEQTVADMKSMMALIPGLKLEIEPEVSILFE